MDKGPFDQSPKPQEYSYDGYTLRRPPSQELLMLVEQSRGKRSDGWIGDSSRFCANFETNMIGAVFLAQAWREFFIKYPKTRNAVPEHVHSILFILEDIPIYIYDGVKKRTVEFKDAKGEVVKAGKVIMKQQPGAPSGIVVEGPLAGLLVQPPGLDFIDDPKEVTHVTASRLIFEPKQYKIPYASEALILKTRALMSDPNTDITEKELLIQELIDFSMRGATDRMNLLYIKTNDSSNQDYPSILSQALTSQGIQINPNEINYILR